MPTDFQKLQDSIFDWQTRTFPKSTGRSKLIGARRELAELIKNPRDEKEWADVLIYFLGGAKSYGHNIARLMRFTRAKMRINKQRKWNAPDKHGVYHHK